jgi:hypothetical protein
VNPLGFNQGLERPTAALIKANYIRSQAARQPQPQTQTLTNRTESATGDPLLNCYVYLLELAVARKAAENGRAS